MDFEFGETEQSKRFFKCYPNFLPALERLLTLSNKCFGPTSPKKNRFEEICFNLGYTCRSDYMEILFLAVNGFGTASLKLLRGLYERAVALAYIIKYPEKAERFVNFAAIQEKKAADQALKLVTEEQFNKENPNNTVAKILERYEKIKEEFQITRCKVCNTKGIAFSWDIDMASMVQYIGAPYNQFFLGAYTIPTLHIHATLASASPEFDKAKTFGRNRQESRYGLLNATYMLILVIQSQDTLFKLGLDDDIQTCWKDTEGAFMED